MSINITYIQRDVSRKVQKVKPVSSVSKVHHNPTKNQEGNLKRKDQSSEFKEILDSKIEENEKGIQKRK